MIDLGKTRGGYFGPWGGVVRPALEWNTVLESAPQAFDVKEL